MAAIENLELQVTADISRAIAKLEDLQEELQDVAESIQAVDAEGADGIDVRTDVDSVRGDLAAVKRDIEAFEAANELNIDTDVDRGLPALPPPDVGANTRMAENVIPDAFAAMAQADPDFGGFNVPTGTGGGGRDTNMMRRLRSTMRDLTQRVKGAYQSLGNFNIRMSDIHNLLATLIPVLFIFIGAIPAVVTALVGLAAAAVAAGAALAAITGFGALGVALEGGQVNMQNLTDVWNDIKESFIEAFAPLAEQLQPLFMDAVDGLEFLFQAIANEGDALMELTDEARAFGGFVMDFLPGALTTLAGLVEALEPILANIGQAINQNFNSFVRQLVGWTEQAVPVVADLVQTVVKALPTIISMGIQFAAVADEVLKLIGFFWNLITVGGALDGAMGFLVATLLLAATAVSLLNKQIFIFAGKAIAAAVTSLYSFIFGLIVANNRMNYLAATTIGSAIKSLYGFVTSLFAGSSALNSFSASALLGAKSAALFWTAVTIGLALPILALVTSMATEFLGLSGSIDQATKSLKEFDRVSSRTSGGSFNPYGGEPPSSGAGAASGGRGGGTTINIESSGNPNEDTSNARYVEFRRGRTTGGTN